MHKTVVVLEHGPLFAGGCGEAILEARGQGAESLAVEKSLWTCGVEAGLEYLRLVTDLVPEWRAMVRFVVSDFVGRNLRAAWNGKGQALESVLESLSTFRPPDPNGDPEACSILNGVSMAVEVPSPRPRAPGPRPPPRHSPSGSQPGH